MICGRCGRSSPESASFCWNCGSPLGAGTAVPGRAPAPGVPGASEVIVPAAPWPRTSSPSGPWPGEGGTPVSASGPWPPEGGASPAAGPWGAPESSDPVRGPWAEDPSGASGTGWPEDHAALPDAPREPGAGNEPGTAHEPWTPDAGPGAAGGPFGAPGTAGLTTHEPWTPAPGPPPFGASPALAAAATPAYSGFWRRFWALVLDGMVVWSLSVPLFILWVMPHFGGGNAIDSWTDDQRMAYTASFFLYWMAGAGIELLYFSIMDSSRHRGSLGKIALSIQITDLAGARIGFGRAFGRRLARILSVFTLGIGFLVMLFSDRRQTLHDIMAGALVVRRTS